MHDDPFARMAAALRDEPVRRAARRSRPSFSDLAPVVSPLLAPPVPNPLLAPPVGAAQARPPRRSGSELPSVIVTADPPAARPARNQARTLVVLAPTVRRWMPPPMRKRSKLAVLTLLAASLGIFVAGVASYVASGPKPQLLSSMVHTSEGKR